MGTAIVANPTSIMRLHGWRSVIGFYGQGWPVAGHAPYAPYTPCAKRKPAEGHTRVSTHSLTHPLTNPLPPTTTPHSHTLNTHSHPPLPPGHTREAPNVACGRQPGCMDAPCDQLSGRRPRCNIAVPNGRHGDDRPVNTCTDPIRLRMQCCGSGRRCHNVVSSTVAHCAE